MSRARLRVSSGTIWEEQAGYCRAIRAGEWVLVSGTTGTDSEGRLVSGGAFEQASQILRNIEAALEKLGATRADVVRTRVYLTRVSDWPLVGRAHAEFFATGVPTTSIVEISALLAPEMLVEIEADAWVGPADHVGA